MGLSGKKIVKVDINFNGDVFFGLLRYRLRDLLHVAPEYLKSCELEQGEWGAVGSIITWNALLDGKTQVVKHNVEALDEKNKLIVFKIFDGDLMKIYKSLKVEVKIDDGNKLQGVNSMGITWSFEYEKMNEDVPDPDSLAEIANNVTKYVESRLNPDSVKIPQLQ